jgi:hypothetical protein
MTGRCHQRVHELHRTTVLLLDLRTEDKKRWHPVHGGRDGEKNIGLADNLTDERRRRR